MTFARSKARALANLREGKRELNSWKHLSAAATRAALGSGPSASASKNGPKVAGVTAPFSVAAKPRKIKSTPTGGTTR